MTGTAALAVLLAAAVVEPAAAPAPPPVEGDEIVVRAVRHTCHAELAGRILSDGEFAARARDWAAGRSVRVVEPAGADYACLARIVIRLHDRGVALVRFVDRADATSGAAPSRP